MSVYHAMTLLRSQLADLREEGRWWKAVLNTAMSQDNDQLEWEANRALNSIRDRGESLAGRVNHYLQDVECN